jgi:hypothetical protein
VNTFLSGRRAEYAQATREAIQASSDPRELFRLIVDARRQRFEQWSALIRQVVAAAPQEEAVRESLELANAAIRGGLARIAQRLADMRALRSGLSVAQAADIMWYYAGNGSYFTLLMQHQQRRLRHLESSQGEQLAGLGQGESQVVRADFGELAL